MLHQKTMRSVPREKGKKMRDIIEQGYAHWILDGGRMLIVQKFKCSNCGTRSAEQTRYCSFCGAKMDKISENVNRCVVCGDVIPEGRMVCGMCEKKHT